MIEATEAATVSPAQIAGAASVSQSLAAPVQQLADQVLLFIPVLFGALLIFLAFWIASIVAARVIAGVGSRARLDVVVRKLLSDSVRLTIITIGAITALGTIGVDVTALVAGLGLTSLALGLAFQDLVRNAISGVLILMYHPFHLGDTITVTGSEGKVVNIDLRYTTLQAEGVTILIPNQSVFSNVVVVNRPPEQAQVTR